MLSTNINYMATKWAKVELDCSLFKILPIAKFAITYDLKTH
jgi:hypothetical protein